jgi:hypothetical protein
VVPLGADAAGPTPTVTVSASPAAVNVTPRQSVTTAVTLTRGGGYNGTASLTLDGARPASRAWRTVSTGGTGVGVNHTCGVTTAGEAFCWGNNHYGQLGDGSAGQGPNSLPVAVLGGRSWTSLSTGSSHTCGVITSGDAYCWGQNASGQLRNGSTSGQQRTPTLVLGDHKRAQVSGGVSTRAG